MSTDIQVSTGGGVGSTGSASTGSASTGAAVMGWGDDWRNRMAAGSTNSEQEIKQLERYESPEQVWRKARSLEQRLSSGELRSTLPKGATTEEVTRWRSENGIPAKPEEYKITLPQGMKPIAEDDPFLKTFIKSAHDANYTQAQLDSAVSSFYAEVNRQQQFIGEEEKKLEQATEDKLRQEWGADYRPNKAMAEALLARAPSGFRDKFMNGSLADRTPIRASSEAWKWLVQMEREINPAATVLPGAGGDLGKTLDTELSDLRKEMANKQSEYWKGPNADKKQARYRELLDAQSRIKTKTGT